MLGDRVSRATSFKIANEQGWETTFDAEYLAVARLQADAFVTVDEEMAKKAEGLVPLAPLSALSRLAALATCGRSTGSAAARCSGPAARRW